MAKRTSHAVAKRLAARVYTATDTVEAIYAEAHDLAERLQQEDADVAVRLLSQAANALRRAEVALEILVEALRSR